MSGEHTSTRRSGRPSRPGGPKLSFTLRLSNTLRTKLQESAEIAQRTLSEEVQERLEQSFAFSQPEPSAVSAAAAPTITINITVQGSDDIARSVEQAVEASRRLMNS